MFSVDHTSEIVAKMAETVLSDKTNFLEQLGEDAVAALAAFADSVFEKGYFSSKIKDGLFITGTSTDLYGAQLLHRHGVTLHSFQKTKEYKDGFPTLVLRTRSIDRAFVIDPILRPTYDAATTPGALSQVLPDNLLMIVHMLRKLLKDYHFNPIYFRGAFYIRMEPYVTFCDY